MEPRRGRRAGPGGRRGAGTPSLRASCSTPSSSPHREWVRETGRVWLLASLARVSGLSVGERAAPDPFHETERHGIDPMPAGLRRSVLAEEFQDGGVAVVAGV